MIQYVPKLVQPLTLFRLTFLRLARRYTQEPSRAIGINPEESIQRTKLIGNQLRLWRAVGRPYLHFAFV
jgi:hypothetical protein